MSSSTTSDVNTSASGRRVTFSSPPKSQPNNSDKIATPLEAALALSQAYIVTLHSGLTTFLSQLVERCLKEYAAYFWANENNKGMRLSTASIPTAVKKG